MLLDWGLHVDSQLVEESSGCFVVANEGKGEIASKTREIQVHSRELLRGRSGPAWSRSVSRLNLPSEEYSSALFQSSCLATYVKIVKMYSLDSAWLLRIISVINKLQWLTLSHAMRKSCTISAANWRDILGIK